MSRYFLILLFVLVTNAAGLTAQATTLSVTEQHIVASVKAHSIDALNLLERSVKINSGTLNGAGVREVGQLFQAEFDQLGFKTKWVEMPPSMQRAGHLVAEHEGTQGKRILLIGHLDTVFEKNNPAPLWIRQGEKIAGPGVLDMKSGDVIIINALRALHEAGVLKNTRIVVVFHGDEEYSGSPLEVARADLINAAKRSDVALAFENMMRDKNAKGNGKDSATIGRRAIGSFSLKTTGKPGHSARIFSDNGYGAIYEMARILNSFRTELIEPDLTFNVGTLLGGTEASYNAQTTIGTASGKKNVIPQIAFAEGDLRYLSYAQRDKAYAHMQEIVANNLPGTSGNIHFIERYPPMSPTPGNRKLLELYSQASSDANLGSITALPPGLRGAGDVQFAAPFVDCLDGLGAAGEGAHSPTEYVELASIERATIRAAILLYRLTGSISN